MVRAAGGVEGLHELLWSFAGHRALTVAVRLGVLRHLAEQEDSAVGVAGRLRLEAGATGKLLRALCALGVLEAEGERYRVGDELRTLFLPGDQDLAPYVEHMHRLYEGWAESLEPWLRGVQVSPRARGAAAARGFSEAMWASAQALAPYVVEALPLSRARRAVDLGGGTGAYALALCRANPELVVTVIDLPEVVALGEELAAARGFADRVRFQAGSYLDADLGREQDLVLLANVLHQEDETTAAGLVARAASVLAPGGRLAVVDFAIDDDKCAGVVAALFAINMRSFGDTYTRPTIERWLTAAGLSSPQCLHLPWTHWLITAERRAGAAT